jgi:hypothetical protein
MSTFNPGTYQSGDGNLNEPIIVGRLGQPLKLGGGAGFTSHGSGPIADSPNAASFGVGTWQDGSKTYVSDGVKFLTSNTSYLEYASLSAANENRLGKIRKRFEEAWAGTTTNYIITGDSTRNEKTISPFWAIIPEYYRYQFSKIHPTALTVFTNACSGLTATHWLDNTGTAQNTGIHLNQALAQIPNTGLNTILEFSLGINDWTLSQDYFTNKTLILACINALLTAKPDLAILLVSPVRTIEFNGRPYYLEALYKEIACELGLPFVSGYRLMDDVFDSTPGPYNTDAIHPNEFGRYRVADGILSAILPPSLMNTVTLEDRLISTGNLAGAILIDKIWNTGTGIQSTAAGWRSLPEITVYGATKLRITHRGNQIGMACMAAGGVFIANATLNQPGLLPSYEVVMPYNTHTVRINISDEGIAYDQRSDNPSVFQKYMPLSLIDNYLNINNAIV